jgi:hypothetical protein
MLCIPIATEILGQVCEMCLIFLLKSPEFALVCQVITKYGFEPTQAGAMKFTAELQKYQEDPQLKAYANNLKSRFMPFASVPADEGAD